MKNVKWLFASILFLVLFSACKNEDDTDLLNDDYLIFGHFYGLCEGEQCIEIFKLDENSLSEDSNDSYPQSDDFYDGNFTVLSEEKFQEVTGLEDLFPEALWDETDKVIGQPEVTDGGGLYIEYNKDGVRDFWIIDLVTENIPEAYKPFVDAAVEKIQVINE